MEHQEALAAYARAAAKEREEYLRQSAVKKANVITRGKSQAEREEYLRSDAFSTLLYQQKRRDKAYQALLRGELVMEYHQEEYRELLPLIESELRHGNEIDLAFLRSVESVRVTLGQAHKALRMLEKQP